MAEKVEEKKPTNIIGVILPTIGASSYDKVMDLLSDQFHTLGYRLIIKMTSGKLEREQGAYQLFSSMVDCILSISIAENYSEIADYVPTQIPVVFLFHKPEGCPRTCIVESDYSATYQGIVSFASRGLNRIACVCNKRSLFASKEALRAYSSALEAMEIEMDERIIFEIKNNSEFDPHQIVRIAAAQNCDAILATSPVLTSGLTACLLFHNTSPQNTPIELLGYGIMDNVLTSHMRIDLITHPSKQIVDLAVQQAMYLMNHPDYKNERVFRLKGTLQTHTYGEFLNVQDYY